MQLNDLKTHPVIKFFAYAAFALIIISFVFFYGWTNNSRSDERIQTAFARYRSDDWNSFLPWRKWETISPSEVQRARNAVLNKKLAFIPQQFLQFLVQQNSDLRSLVSDEEAVQQAMDIRLLVREADRLGVVVPDAEVHSFVMERYPSYDMLQAEAQAFGLTTDQLLREFGREQRAARAQRLIADEARVSLYELWLEYLLIEEKLTLKIASFAAADFKDRVETTREEAAAYLEKNAEDFRIPAQRRYAYVKVDRADLREGVEATEEELRAFHERNQAKFAVAEAVRLQDLYAPVDADQSTTVAQALLNVAQFELSAGDATTSGTLDWSLVAQRAEEAVPGGTLYFRDLGWIERNDTNRRGYGPDFLDRAFTLTDDRISTPVQSPSGMHVVKRLEYRAAGVSPFEEVRDRVAEEYKDDKSRELFRQKFDSLAEQIRGYTTLRDFAQAAGLEDALTTLTATTATFIPEVGNLSEHRNYLRGLELDQVSELIPIPAASPNSFVALQIVQENETRIPPLEEVEERVMDLVATEKAREIAKTEADAAFKAVAGGEDFDAVASRAPKEPVETEPFARPESSRALGLPMIGFDRQTGRIAQGSIGLTPYGASEEEAEGFALWKVVSVEQPSREKFREDRRRIEAEVLTIQGLATVEEWLADRRREVGYEILIGRSAE